MSLYLISKTDWFQTLKDTIKPFHDFKNKQKIAWGNVLWYVKVCIFRNCIQYTINWDKTQILKKFLSDKRTVQKMLSFSFCELQLITVLLLICNYYMSSSARFVSLKLYVRFPIFDSVSFLLNFVFLSNKMTLKLHNSFQNRKARHRFAPRPMIFKLQQEVLKFNDILVSSRSQTWPSANFFKLRKSKFWERQFFSSVVTFMSVFDISLLNKVFASY